MIYALKNKERARMLQPGFTLIEIVIVLALIAGILALVGPMIYQRAFRGQRSTTETKIKLAQQAIEQYKFDVKKYPEKLRDLYMRPADEKKWNGPYIDKEEDPMDAWDNVLQYKRTPGAKHPYELYSYGSDEGSETPEDKRIDVWEI